MPWAAAKDLGYMQCYMIPVGATLGHAASYYIILAAQPALAIGQSAQNYTSRGHRRI